MARTFLLILACVCFASQCLADVGTLRQYRFQRQRQQVQAMPYPAAGFRPGRQFVLPQEQTQQQNAVESDTVQQAETQPQRPELTYGAPVEATATQSARLLQAQQEQQQFFVSPETHSKSARLMAQSARLAVNSEDMPEDAEDEIASDIEVDVKTEMVPRMVAANPQASTVYYPAGAVSFVQPFSGATFVQPAQAPVTSIAQPTTAAYVQPFQFSNFQLQAAAAPAAPIAPITAAQPAAAKLQAQPAIAAKLEAQPVAAPAPAPFFASPAAYTAIPSFYTSPTAAYTSPIAQPQFYFSAPAATASAQLQAW